MAVMIYAHAVAARNIKSVVEDNMNIPHSLKRPLQFGDTDQIEALNEIEREIAAQEELTNKALSGELSQYTVYITYEGVARKEVWASSREQAAEIARKGTDDESPDEWEVTNVAVL